MPGRPRLRTARDHRGPERADIERVAARTTASASTSVDRRRPPRRRHRCSRSPVSPPAAISTRTIVVASQAIVPSASGASVGMREDALAAIRVDRLRSRPARRRRRSDQFAHFVATRPSARSCPRPACPRASASAKCSACFSVDLRRHRRLVRVDHRLDQRRARAWPAPRAASRRSLPDRRCVKPATPKPSRDRREVDRLQLADIFRIAQEDHLLPFDLAEHVVLDDDDLHVELVFHAGRELAHQHGEAAIADEARPPAARDRRPRRRSRRAGRRPWSRDCRSRRTSCRRGSSGGARPRW